MYKSSHSIQDHLTKHASIYFFMIILFLIGIIFGAIIVNSMNFVQKEDLFFYLDRFFGQIVDGTTVSKQEMLKNTFFYHFSYLMLLFVLGLSIIGLPIIWILLFVKGLVVGFSVGFFVNQMGWQGLIFATASIAPQNLIVIPTYLIAGSLAMIFSLSLLQKLFSRKMHQPIIQPFVRYMSLFISLIGLAVIASMIEAFISNEAMQIVINWIYK
ncbi:stage II sporulation protein M [Aquibacillus salsiterrae]|uniref:Stage II sporulation protein M n=1 Tax=Aquibacillus salsiterrae TaxID=2950439 RepID=A0A9X3WDI4_9BACI|nr:stage II sporulation protein M [Aquibacillus salsiterrae]MDC3415439.1 stage II sporulation protein M [Aquibacillus salsiterrae]